MNHEKAKQIVAENLYMTISTASASGEPWVSPVFFAHDDQYNLYWVSNKEAKHSRNVAENPRIAIVIFDSTAPEGEGDGVYFACSASALTDPEEIVYGMEIYNAKASQEEFRIASADTVIGNTAWRLYKAVPNEISTLGDGGEVNGQYIDQRVEITESLRNVS